MISRCNDVPKTRRAIARRVRAFFLIPAPSARPLEKQGGFPPDRFQMFPSTHGVDPPCRPRSTPTSGRAVRRPGRSQESVEGGVGPVAGVSAAWMPRPSPQG
ncbi:hypothetical protein STRNTR1_3128 [Stenotrophomonas maltophilia]|nr:hypothetical protein STRNTR1_3128 [Stenotrophomonas maltophilia]